MIYSGLLLYNRLQDKVFVCLSKLNIIILVIEKPIVFFMLKKKNQFNKSGLNKQFVHYCRNF